ncbi:MAG TPA: hypothetical protein VHC20_06795 [Candidatus Paceibacterota bacterium]|nr:hypothetical protein [Candidatus Paceibacterota bacterium]
MPGRGFKIPDDMLPHRERLSEAERRQFVRSWRKLALRSRKARFVFLAAFCCVLSLFALFLPPWGFDGGARYFMYFWEPFASFFVATYFPYRSTKKVITREVALHLGLPDEEA